MTDAHAYDLLKAAVNASSMGRVSVEIGYSRTTVSLYLSGKYDADPSALEAAIRAKFDRFNCLHTGQEITGPECGNRASSPRPFGGRAKQAYWEACQCCTRNEHAGGYPMPPASPNRSPRSKGESQ